MKHLLFIPLLLSSLCAFAEETSLVVWDGEDVARGSGWASPKIDKNTFKPQTNTVHSGASALALHLEGERWIAGGWSWHGWWPADAGTDTTPFTHLTFQLLHAGDPVENFSVALTCSATKNACASVPIADHLKRIDLFDNNWHKISIPLTAFKSAEDKPFDPKTVWEITFGSWSEEARAFSLFIDDITFVKNEPEFEW